MGAGGLFVNVFDDVYGATVAVVQQVLLVADMVIKCALGHMQLFGDFVQGGAVEPFPVEQPGAGLVERVLLQALLLRPVKTFQLTIDRVIYVDGGWHVFPFAAVQAMCEDVDCLCRDGVELIGGYLVQP